MIGFNTQPREGGCPIPKLTIAFFGGFNTQPREGGCLILSDGDQSVGMVSTHSRAKAAA